MRPSPQLLRLAFGALLAAASGRAVAAGPAPAAEPRVLVRVAVGKSLADLPVPVHAHLQGADGSDYALAFGPSGTFASVPGTRGLAAAASPEEFVVATERRRGARAKAATLAEVLYDDGRHVVARATEAQAEALSGAGFDLARLPATPIVVSAAREPTLMAVTYDPGVAVLVSAITETVVSDTVGDLSGERPVVVGGTPVTIATRHTASGTPILNATQHAFEHFAASGLSPSYHSWSWVPWTGRNVVADLPGTTLPAELVVVCAHLDDMPAGSLAPGADDDASGSTAVLLAARTLAGARFHRTIRFVLFTGEEQGLRGSAAYASLLASAGANVVAVLNLDMIGYDGIGTPTALLHTRSAAHPGYAADAAIADTLIRSAALYVPGELQPFLIADGETASDHSSFWNWGYPGILAIEDDLSDFNPWYHTPDDKLSGLDLGYLTAYVKSALAAAAHLAGPAPRATSFHPLTPCRAVDTRDAARPAGLGPPALSASGVRAFAVPSVCGVPPDAVAIAVNATVTEPAATGWVTLFPGAGTPPSTSSVHFQAGRTRATFSVLPLGSGAVFSASNASAGAAHLIVDVAGFFR